MGDHREPMSTGSVGIAQVDAEYMCGAVPVPTPKKGTGNSNTSDGVALTAPHRRLSV
jgi:hypothetical protein